MRILVTGGAGFIASHIQDAYLAAGHQVAVLDNLSSGDRKNIHPQSQFFQVDLNSPDLAKVIADFQPEIINHHAAQINVRRSVEDPQYDCQVNALGLLNLLEAAKKHAVRKVIFASSGGAIYGEQNSFPADESHPTQPSSPYGISKLIGEKYLDFYQQTHSIQSVVFRYANVYGPRQNPHGEAGVISIFLQKMLQNDTLCINGDGQQTRDYVFVSDVVTANMLALKEGVSGTYNIGTGVETTVWDLYRNLCALTAYTKEPQSGPAQAGEQRRSVISAEKIKKAWGWKVQFDLQAGLEKTSSFYSRCLLNRTG